jgi:hypothetical protein
MSTLKEGKRSLAGQVEVPREDMWVDTGGRGSDGSWVLLVEAQCFRTWAVREDTERRAEQRVVAATAQS